MSAAKTATATTTNEVTHRIVRADGSSQPARVVGNRVHTMPFDADDHYGIDEASGDVDLGDERARLVPVDENGGAGGTGCCNAETTFHDDVLCCKACWNAVSLLDLT